MPDSIGELLRRDMQCEGLLECLHGLKDLDRDCFLELARSDDPLTVDELADRVDRERSTAYRSVQRLMQANLISKEQVNYDDGGYYHVYYAGNADEKADDMQRMLNEWYAELGQLIQEFRDKYDEHEQMQASD
jgi:predicted transcriptional regulator